MSLCHDSWDKVVFPLLCNIISVQAENKVEKSLHTGREHRRKPSPLPLLLKKGGSLMDLFRPFDMCLTTVLLSVAWWEMATISCVSVNDAAWTCSICCSYCYSYYRFCSFLVERCTGPCSHSGQCAHSAITAINSLPTLPYCLQIIFSCFCFVLPSRFAVAIAVVGCTILTEELLQMKQSLGSECRCKWYPP